MSQLYGFDSPAYRAAQEAANKYRDELQKQKPGVVAVRAGYRVVNQWVTTTPAIVVSVNKKLLRNYPNIRENLIPIMVAPNQSTPEGMIRLNWNDVFGE